MPFPWRKIRERIAFWIAPRLPKLLQRSLNSIELLEGKAQTRRPEDFDLRMEIMGELQEAAALADGSPWRSGPTGNSYASKQLMAAHEAIKRDTLQESKDVSLRETIYGMAELEIALDDRGWKRLIAQSQYEFSRMGIQSIMLICRLYYIKNPLARRGVDVSAFYVFGRGLEISSPEEVANETLNDFFSDPRNASQFSHTALVKKEKQTYTDGNIFLAFFVDPEDGRLESRALDPVEISDIITDPNDSETPWFYRRDWTEMTFDPTKGIRDAKQRTSWFFAMGWEDTPNFPRDQRMIEGFPVEVDSTGQPIVVLHHKDGELPGWRFGCPRMYPALDWLRAYRHVLEDLCTLWRALSRFAWNVETEGGAPAIAAFKQTLATTLANDLTQIETNPPPVTGAAFISGPTNKITPFQSGGATTMNPDNARRVLLMICSAFGIAENLFGDATTGSLATAASLERPTELMFLERQEVWREVIQRVGAYVLTRSLRAPKGKLREAYAKRAGQDTSSFDPSTVLIESAPRKYPGGITIKLAEKQGKAVRSGLSQSSAAGQQDPIKAKGIAEAGRDTPEKITIEVKFPDILAHEIKDRVAAIVQAVTLDGKEPIGIDQKTAFGLLLSELGVEDPTVVLEAMFPAASYQADRTIVPEVPPLPTTAKVDVTDNVDGKQDPEGISKDPEVIERAVRQIMTAAFRKTTRSARAGDPD